MEKRSQTNPKRTAIIIVSVILTVLIVIAAAAGILLYRNNKDTVSDPSSDVASSEPAADNSDPSEVTAAQAEVRPEKITNVYEYKQMFIVPEFDQLTFYDDKTGKSLPYSLYVPDDYNKDEKYPVLLLLHGAGEVGNDYKAALKNFTPLFTLNGDIVSKAIIICPQCPEDGWWYLDEGYPGNEQGWLGAAMRLLLNIESTYSCDPDRIYVTGLSMGGFATWSLLERYSSHFAAGAPICGWGDETKGSVLADIPIWIYHGTDDQTVSITSSQSMYDAIIDAGGTKVNFTRLPGVNHNSWDDAYSDREMLSWMFDQNKATNPNCDYTVRTVLEIVDADGETAITNLDIKSTSYDYNKDSTVKLTIELKDDGAKRLKEAYARSNGRELAAYYGGYKLFTFTVTGEPADNTLVIDGALKTPDFYDFNSKINQLNR